ncbi:MAG: 50S ribosomal protein L14e [Promethearchaeota archaeon]
MGVYTIGQVCVKLLGREAGYLCTIVEVIDKSFVLIDGLKVRRRRCNLNHLAPLKEKIEIKAGDDTKTVEEAIEKAKLTKKFQTKIVPKIIL